MKKVSIFDGKNKFSELVSSAAKGEPQLITKNGTPTAVVLSFDEYRRLTANRGSFSEFLLNSPLRGSKIDLSRDKRFGRPTLDLSKDD